MSDLCPAGDTFPQTFNCLDLRVCKCTDTAAYAISCVRCGAVLLIPFVAV
jgi:hypothetical protein